MLSLPQIKPLCVCLQNKQIGSNVPSLADENKTNMDYDEILTTDLEPAHGIHTITDAKFQNEFSLQSMLAETS